MNEKLSQKIDQIEAMLKECEQIAKEVGESFSIDLPNDESLKCVINHNRQAYWPEWYSSSC